MHTGDEMDILNFLRSYRQQYVSGREICRRAGGRRKFEQDPRWAMPIIIGMVVRGFIEADGHGHFRAAIKDAQTAPASPCAPAAAPSGVPGQAIEITNEEAKDLLDGTSGVGGRIPL